MNDSENACQNLREFQMYQSENKKVKANELYFQLRRTTEKIQRNKKKEIISV